MKAKMLPMILFFLILNCKENSDSTKSKIEEQKQETATIFKIPASIKELVQFAEINLSDSTDINELMLFKEIDAVGAVTEIDLNRAITLYRNLIKNQQATSLPIFELKDTDTAILPIQGTGFGGAIWAKVLVDKNTLEIKKIAFEHKAESDGYGAAMTQNAFEEQFIGKRIDFEKNTFGLQKEVEKTVDNGNIIDGISGATITSQGAVVMVNEGLRSYRNYLKP